MNTKQEIVDVFDGQPSSDCPPPAVFTQTGTSGQMMACGASWPEANFDADKMGALALQLSRQFGFATARVPYCLTVEAERLGATIYEGRNNSQPSVSGSPFRTDEMVPGPVPDDLMSPDEFVSGGRCVMVAEVAGRIMREHEDLFVTAGMQDPACVAGQILGTENMMMGYMLDPDIVKAWVDAMVPFTCAYGRLLSENADNVTIVGAANTDVFTPEMYTDLTESQLSRTIGSISCFKTVHSCGNSYEFIDSLVTLGADGLSLEASHETSMYMDKVAGRCKMFGTVNPVQVLLMSSPRDVVSEAKRSADAGFDIITPECGVPPMTPDENLLALSQYRERRW